MVYLTSEYFGNTILQYLYFFGTIAVAVLLGKIIAWVSENVARKASAKTKSEMDDKFIDVIERPLVFLLFVLGFYFGQNFLDLTPRAAEIFGNVVEMLITVDVAWFLINFVDSLLIHYLKPLTSKTESDLDDHILPLLRKLVKFIVISITAVMIIDNFGYDVTSLIAGLGLGGLAFALAAKDLLGNLFGGIAIATDRPFKIGDRIKVGSDVDGWVRDIGLRTTRIETFDGTMMTVPNSKLVDSIMENISVEPARRVKVTIGLEYGTSYSKVKKAKKILADVCKDIDGIRDECRTSFWDFGESSLQILFIYWIEDKDNILGLRDEVNMEVKKRFNKANISMAFPTRTVHVEK